MIPEAFGQESLSNKSDSKQLSNVHLRYLSYEKELRTQIAQKHTLPMATGLPLNTMSENGQPKSQLRLSSEGHAASDEHLRPPAVSSRHSGLQNRTQEHALNVIREGQGAEAVQSKSELLTRGLLP